MKENQKKSQMELAFLEYMDVQYGNDNDFQWDDMKQIFYYAWKKSLLCVIHAMFNPIAKRRPDEKKEGEGK